MTTNGKLEMPDIQISGPEHNGWYTGDVTITITDTASDTETGATGIYYSITEGSQKIFDHTENGVFTTTYTYRVQDGEDLQVNAHMIGTDASRK